MEKLHFSSVQGCCSRQAILAQGSRPNNGLKIVPVEDGLNDPPHLMAATPGTCSPFPLGRGSRNGLRTYYKEEYDLNAEDLVAQTSSHPVKVRSYGVVEHFLAYAVPGGLPDLTPMAPQRVEGRGHGRLVLLSSWRLRTCSLLV